MEITMHEEIKRIIQEAKRIIKNCTFKDISKGNIEFYDGDLINEKIEILCSKDYYLADYSSSSIFIRNLVMSQIDKNWNPNKTIFDGKTIIF